jgi:hypothetical protein
MYMVEREKTSNHPILVEAKEAESQGDTARAITLYQQAVANGPQEEQGAAALISLTP